MNIELTLNKLAKKHGFSYHWQDTAFNTRRAVIPCGSYNQLSYIQDILKRVKNISINHWVCFEGEFEGYVYVMSADDAELFIKESTAETNKVNDWWNRYHFADDETRKLMACGAIS